MKTKAQLPNSLNLQQILSGWHSELNKLEHSILKGVHTDIPLLTQVAEYILHSGGKRLRPTMVLLGGAALGSHDERLVPAAQVIEYLHTATLLHDDVVDNADTRRSQRAARKIWGNEASVLTGDYLLSMAFYMLTRLRHLEILKLMSATTTKMARGELLQLTCSYTTANEHEYLEIIINKTACLFAAAIKMGALLGGAKEAMAQSLYQYGLSIGVAFQIVDDILDYTDEQKTGKSVGIDLQERKITLPLSHLLDNASPQDQQDVKEILALPRIHDVEIQRIIGKMKNYDSLEYSLGVARNYVQEAHQHLQLLPDGSVKKTLHNIADFIVYRKM